MTTERRCVDYLAHEWYPADLIMTHREIRRQARNVTPKERYRLARFQNALWRQMARTLTNRLGKSNPMVDPATVDWQKESDVTWLYGPIYHENERLEEAITDLPLHNEQHQRAHDEENERRRRREKKHNAAKTRRHVRFSPEIIEYDAPRIPVDDEHPSILGSVVAGLKVQFKAYLFATSSPSPKEAAAVGTDNNNDQMAVLKRQPQQPASMELSMLWAATAVLKSFTSVVATWILYRGFGRLMRRTWRIRQQQQQQHPFSMGHSG